MRPAQSWCVVFFANSARYHFGMIATVPAALRSLFLLAACFVEPDFHELTGKARKE
jgi:hypothetical protein